MRFAKILPPLVAALALSTLAQAQPSSPAEPLAARFAALGLQPMGGKSYLQPIHRVEQQLQADRSSAALTTAKGAEPLAVGRELVLDLSFPAGGKLDARMVFIGYGLSTPGAGYDDFTGRNLAGAVLVAVEGAPIGLSDADAARARQAYTAKALEKSGAVGLIVIRRAVAQVSGAYAATEAKQSAFAASLDPTLADRLFAGSGYSFAEVEALMQARRPLAGFVLAKRFKADFRTERHAFDETAVMAVLPGADPNLSADYVLATTRVAAGGDGTEALAQLAARLKAAGPSRRPILLAAFPENADGGAAARILLDAKLRLGKVAAAFALASSSTEAVALRGGSDSSLGASAERIALLHQVSLTDAPLAVPADTVAADAPMLALSRPSRGQEGFDAFAADLIHQTAQSIEPPRWAPGAAFAPPAFRAQEIDNFRLQMPISMKRIRTPSGQG